MENEELTLRFVRFLQVWSSNTLALFDDSDLVETRVIGRMRPEEVTSGNFYRLWGRWETHPKYDRQFRVKSFTLTKPQDRSSTVAYLRRAPGMTKARALRVVRHFEAGAIEMLRDHPREVCDKCRMFGFTYEKADEASEYLKGAEKYEFTHVELLGLFEGLRVPRDLAEQCIRKWGVKAAETIKENPYSLLNFSGVGFLTADRLYLSLGKDPAAIERQGLCLWHELRTLKGHTWADTDAARGHLDKKIGEAEVKFGKAVRWGIETKHLKARRDTKGKLWLAEYYRYVSEYRVAWGVAWLLHTEPRWPDTRLIADCSDHQKAVLEQALSRRIGILSGPPGTGKSYVAAQLVKLLKHGDRWKKIALCAPTGKAAVRFTELMRQVEVPLHATTIHRLLGVEFEDGEAYHFVHGLENHLEYEFVIVDEASMLDTDLAGALLSALNDHAHLLLIGDVEQLPPVGHGAPLRDLIDTGLVPVGQFTEIRRNLGAIVAFASAIKNEEPYALETKLKLEFTRNLMLSRQVTEKQQLEKLLSALDRLQERGLNVVWGLQVICATNEGGLISRVELNAVLQGKLNGANESASGFWQKDKVICTRNSWFPPVEEMATVSEDVMTREDKDGNTVVYVANGEQGEVLRDEPNRTLVEFSGPRRYVVVPRGEGKEALALGYAITAHKSQGSEWPIVIGMLDGRSQAAHVCDRSWLYTLVSRAKTACILIGTELSVNQMRARKRLERRKTFLGEQLVVEIDALQKTSRSEEVDEPVDAASGASAGAIHDPGGHTGAGPVDVPRSRGG